MVFERHPATADHHAEQYAAMLGVDGGAESQPVLSEIHYSIELLGVDSKYQGSGLGKQLLEMVCAMSESEGIEVDVTANLKAKSFYERRGFTCSKEVLLPGSETYGEAFLVYKPKSMHQMV